MIEKTPPLHIGLLWHSATSGNLGVGALTVANIAIVRAAADAAGVPVRLTIMGMADGDCPSVVGADVAVRTITMRALLSPTGMAAWLRTMDAVVDIGAGDSFADIYSAKRFFMLWFSKWLAVAARVPLILAPQTIGPFTRAPYTQLAGWIMNRATAVVARDRASLALAQALAPRARAMLAADVAFALPYTDCSAQRAGGGADVPADGAGRVRVGINVSGLLYHQAETGANHFALDIDYAAYIHALIAQLTARRDVEVMLVTHAISGRDATDDDGAIADRLAAQYPARVRVPAFAHPSDAKSFISSLDFLIASRMHACIAACSSGVPFLPVAYSRKFEGVFGLIGYDWQVPVRGLDTAQAVAATLAAFDDRVALGAAISAGL
ncbi:MAG: polysaccharide pyruvyl transferase family protein, partial [Sphingopyxis sp.]